MYYTNLNHITNKVRFYYIKSGYLLKKYKTILKICPKGMPNFLAFVSLGICFYLNIYPFDGCLRGLSDIIKNVCYSYIAGYIFYLVSDIFPKANKTLNEINYIIENEICILKSAKSMLDISIQYSCIPNEETDTKRRFIINCTDGNPYKDVNRQIKFNDSFLNSIRFAQNECRYSFNLLLLHKADLLSDKDKSLLYHIRDFIFLSLFHNLAPGCSIYLSEFEFEYDFFIGNIKELESSIKEKMDTYVYYQDEFEKFNELLKKTDDFGIIGVIDNCTI